MLFMLGPRNLNHFCVFQQICDSSINTVKMRPDSRILAAGNAAGKLYLVKVSDDLTVSAKQDKGLLTAVRSFSFITFWHTKA